MVTFSCCMIVKNEAKILRRCLDSICDLMDEIIIVDTGSTDETRTIAAEYTDQVYDFPWSDDFSAARNFSFEKASMDYIYVPDADEYLDPENHEQLRLLKVYLDPQIEIVQMMYHTVSQNTVLNIQNEYRPKLFKRLRSFIWIDPIHETVRLDPLVFDSDVVITHAPAGNHSRRDFGIYQKAIRRDGGLSAKVTAMYAAELMKMGEKEHFLEAAAYFEAVYRDCGDLTIRLQAACVLTRLARLQGDGNALKRLMAEQDPAKIPGEMCYDFGMAAVDRGEYPEAAEWFQRACDEASSLLDVHTCGDLALEGLCDCCRKMMETEEDDSQKERLMSRLTAAGKRLEEWAPPMEQNEI